MPEAQVSSAEAPKEPEKSEQAPESEAPVKEPTGETPEKPPEKSGKNRFERRLDKAYRRAAEAEARAQLFERQLTDLRSPRDDGAPKLEQFNDIEKYADAKAKYESDKRVKQLQAEQATNLSKQALEKLVADWEDAAGKAEPDDFDEVVGELKPETPLNIAIMESDWRVAYHLGTHPDEVKRISGLTQIGQVRAIGKLEEKLLAEPEKPKPSKAPAPIEPVTGNAETSGEPDPSNAKKWIAWRQKQVHKRR